MADPSLLTYLRKYRRSFIFGGVCLLATNALGLAIPKLLQFGVDRLERAKGLDEVGQLAWAIVAVAVGQAAIRIASRTLIFFAARRIEFDLRNDTYDQVTRLAQSYYQARTTGDVISRATNDLTNVRVLLGPGILNIVNTSAVYIAAPVLLLLISPWLTLLALVPYPLMLLLTRKHVRGIYTKTKESQEELSRLSARVQENLGGMSVVKAYSREDWETSLFRGQSEAYRIKSLELARHRAQILPLMGLMGGAAILIVLVGGGAAVRSGHITLGEFVAFSGYLGYLVWPTLALGWILSLWQRGIASWERLREFLGAEPTLKDPARARSSDVLGAQFEISGLRIVRGGEAILDIPDLRIAAGSTVAIVGGTGSGKSTLAEALARLSEVPEGTIRVDAVDVCQLPLRWYRSQIGYVPQETFLFSATIAQNIAFGRPAATEQEIRRAAAVARVAGDIESFPAGYETIVGERGITLSGGQRQRIAIARALLVNPRVLILDDCLSAVDLKTEREILAGLREELPGRTALIISHRLAAARLATEILVLDRGRVIERGHHDELIDADGAYARLWRRQMMIEEIEDFPEAAQ